MRKDNSKGELEGQLKSGCSGRIKGPSKGVKSAVDPSTFTINNAKGGT